MDINHLITEIRTLLNATFSAIDSWFDKDETMRQYKPLNGGWSIDQILEHISLTNHYLLILIEKGTRKALQNATILGVQTAIESYTFQREKLTAIGLHKSFSWMRPDHMEPNGEKSLTEIRQQLRDHVTQCFDSLDHLKNGEGTLYTTTMTVNGLGKIDVYEYIYFLAQHGQRHLTQMTRNESEYIAQTKASTD